MTCSIEIPGFDFTRMAPDSAWWKDTLQFGGYVAEGYRTAFEKFQDLLKNGLVPEQQKMNEAAKALADNYQGLADRVNQWRNEMPTKGPIAMAYF